MTSRLEKVLPGNLQFLNSSNDVYTLEVGNRTKNTFEYTATSHSTSSTTWAFNTPSDKIVMNRRFLLRVQFTANAAGAGWGTGAALRQYAPMSAARLVELTLNGQKSHSLPSEHLHAFARFNTNEEQRGKFMTGCPSQPDCGEYTDWPRYDVSGQVDNNGVLGGAVTCISTPNVNSPFAVETNGNEAVRSSFGYYTGAGADRVYVLYCPVFCSPLSWNTSNDGLANISKVNLRIDWASLLQDYLFSVSTTVSGLNTATGAITITNWEATKPTLLCEYTDPVVDIPPVLAFDHVELQTDVVNLGMVNSNTVFQDKTNTTQFMDIVPTCVYVFVRQQVSTMTVNSADVFAGLTALLVR